jgi:hypothetical protein
VLIAAFVAHYPATPDRSWSSLHGFCVRASQCSPFPWATHHRRDPFSSTNLHVLGSSPDDGRVAAAAHCSRKIDQVRISVWQRVSEHEDSMQSLLTRRANLEEVYGKRIQEVLSGEEQTNKIGGAKHIEEVMKDERQSRSQNSGTPTKRGAVNHNDQAQMSKSSSGSILSAPLPEKGTNRAILAGRLEMEKSRLYDDLSREISALEVAQAQERAALHAAASEILQAVSSQVFVQTFRTHAPSPLCRFGIE